MAKFLLSYHGGAVQQTDAEQQAAMEAWMSWFGQLGSAVVDLGNPVGASATVASDGAVADGGGANPVTGYSLIDAADLGSAIELAKGCPVLAGGGSVEVAETIDVGG